jgi:myo-inositol-1-phosphate synthase
MDLAKQLIQDIQEFQKEKSIDRMVMAWAASTEVYLESDPVHWTVESFEKGLEENNPAISPSMIYAYASLKLGIPFINGAPNLCVDILL